MSSQSSGRKNTMSEEVEISVVVKLPKGHYQVASGLTRIYDYANFDEYVSNIIKENIELSLDDVASKNSLVQSTNDSNEWQKGG
jgi:hypothetical protein